MRPTADEVLKTAKTLPRDERAELTQGLLATLGEHDVSESARLHALRAAVDNGVADLDAGNSIEIKSGGLRNYVRERGRLATQRAAAKTA